MASTRRTALPLVYTALRAPTLPPRPTLSNTTQATMSGAVPYRQDLPPSGGYQPIRYKRNLPGKNLSGLTIFGGVIAICAYGFYKVGQGNLEQRELKRERAWSRIHLIPLLMAESDRDAFRRSEAQLAREKEIMKDVPGWEAGKSVYNTKRYTPPNFVVL
ncbi:NADH:ubiquinone oxidoreductase, B16.6 subunit [Moesziomyces antarcticus T-34]|uniref:NADH dehydrogenase [ubiquinone] 1 alpha subcomplex subunit 13 n=2 Tax=Pseudozyma antarctica TaxID=84753 RepID=M9LWF4_PSEA3|nr:NADH:ubiquinone oxidoreductase, B16.6 subunit [Moesziomyces antarcticus T-34]